ncbi:MAG: ParB N-terminal domain-containing protein [Halobacteriovoraceae bacterium]|nr:ParB N-terminal domain-containing protein [Halobacteriovoraceae bacterium]
MSEKQIKYLNVDDLLLDDENPRLPQDISSEVDILEFICTNYAVEELVEAIGENGYFAGEPLIVIKNPNGDNNYIVVEGNRRLSALKVLNNPELYPDENLKKLAKDAKTSPSSIPSVIFANRNEVANYLGLRHITGVKSWGPLSKARYLKQIFDKTSEHGTLEVRLNSVAKSVGSRSDYIRRNLTTLAVYNLIKEKDYFGIENMDDKNFHHFSVFQSALSKPPIRNYLAVPDSYKLDLEDDLNVDNLKFLTKIIVEKKRKWKNNSRFSKKFK